MLDIKNLSVSIDDKVILEDINLKVEKGQTHVIMGPNGSGKTTLTNVLSGYPDYAVYGEVLFQGEDLLKLDPEERAQKGLFVSLQNPVEIPGISNLRFLHAAYNSIKRARKQSPLAIEEFETLLDDKMTGMQIGGQFKSRGINEGFSGGEKKRNELLQMAVLEPIMAILDEIDSGLDIDSLRVVAKGINNLKNEENGLLLITHYNRILEYIEPDFVHILMNGKIVQSGGASLPIELEKRGYYWFVEC